MNNNNPLKQYRDVHSLTQQDIADKLEVNIRTVRRWEQKTPPRWVFRELGLTELKNDGE